MSNKLLRKKFYVNPTSSKIDNRHFHDIRKYMFKDTLLFMNKETLFTGRHVNDSPHHSGRNQNFL